MFVYLHCFDGIHKFDEPVSNTTLKLCGGVPIEMAPKYWAYGGKFIKIYFIFFIVVEHHKVISTHI